MTTAALRLDQEMAAATPASSTKLAYVQHLRFYAALAVVAFHAVGDAKKAYPDQVSGAPSALGYGDLGVDVFFVISGFIICQSTRGAGAAPMEFLFRRLARILPLYWTMSVAIVALALLTPGLFTDSSWASASMLARSATFTAFATGQTPLLHVGWSLEFEMFFYLAVWLLLWRRAEVWSVLTIAFCALVMLRGLPVSGPGAFAWTFITHPLLLEFCYGVAIARVFRSDTVPAVCWVALAVATASVAYENPAHRVIVAGSVATALVALSVRASASGGARSWIGRTLVQLGDASYSIYLIQVFVISAVSKAARRSGLFTIDQTTCLATLATILLGYVCYRFFERPCLRFLSSLRRSGGRSSAGPAISQPMEHARR